MTPIEKMKMKSILFVRRFFAARGIFISKNIDVSVLTSFFDMIKPVATNHDLIRLGAGDDGGYLIPNDLAGINICFSPGVSITADFELELANRGITCFMADYSVEKPPLSNPLFHFEKKFLGSENNQVFMTLNDWVSKNAPEENDLILQMDIEGAEYEVIMDAKQEILQKFRIIVIEFHDLEFLLSKIGHQLISNTFKKILRNFEIVHIHPNNIMKEKRFVYRQFEIPSVLEITFLRKDRISIQQPLITFPHPQDKPNSQELDDYVLPHCWFNRTN
jgi:hypothetical protein